MSKADDMNDATAARPPRTEPAAAIDCRSENEQLRRLFNVVPEGIVVVDGHGRVLLVNEVARVRMGLPLDTEIAMHELAGLDLRSIDGSLLPAEQRPMARAIRGERVDGMELLYVSRDGTTRRFSTSCAITMDGAQVAVAVLVFRDVTEQRELEKRVTHAERLASLGTLAAGVAHEINNPLAYVSTNLELALEEVSALRSEPDADWKQGMLKMLRDAQHGAERVRKIVHGLMDLVRSGEAPRSVVDVCKVLDRSIDMTSNETRQRGSLVKVFGPTPLVEVDADRLGQVFINLLLNAAHALAEGGAASNEIRVVTSTSADGSAVIDMHDNGCGIAPDLLLRVFDPFFTTKPVGIGTGLGLSICHQSVRAMGGDISAESSAMGTRFRVVLPASKAPLVETPSVAPAAVATQRSGSVLVVDDEAAIGATIGRVLKAHHVTSVTSAPAALALLAAGQQFDVVLSDLMMPEMSGMQFYDELVRSYPEHAARVVFLSGGAFTADARAFLERVPNERLEKPFDLRVLRATVLRHLQPGEEQ